MGEEEGYNLTSFTINMIHLRLPLSSFSSHVSDGWSSTRASITMDRELARARKGHFRTSIYFFVNSILLQIVIFKSATFHMSDTDTEFKCKCWEGGVDSSKRKMG